MNLRWFPAAPVARKLLCPRNCQAQMAILRTTTTRATITQRRIRRRVLNSWKGTMALLQATYRDAGAVTVLDLSGRITLGEGSALLRSTIRELIEDHRTMILVNLGDINYIDSSGIGELVSAFTAVKNRGGELKLLHLTKKVHDLLQITKLFTVFDVHSDEVAALRSFDKQSA